VTDSEPRLIGGGSATDDRGTLRFVNEIDLSAVRRFYVVSNHRAGMVRAWHGHQREGKYVTVLQGAAVVAAVHVADWTKPDPKARVHRFVLSANSPSVLFIPPGYANGAMSLTADALIQYFSTATLDESKGDDIRFDARFWNPWQVEER
jgi:dTDP-4-dehydrorhamnose 3,5-epimerase-like enzyme